MKILLSFLAVFALSLFTQAQQAPSLEGTWLGGLHVNAGVVLHTAFHFTRDSSGKYTATVDSLDQGATGIPVESVTLNGTKLNLRIPVVSAGYEGTVAPDGQSIEGTWTQGPASLPLLLKRAAAAEVAALTPHRPQNPVKPYPYREEEITFANPVAKITLAGTVTLPEGKGPFPAVILITGSGPQNRDEELLGHKPFLVLSDYLTRHGLAVLRVDDRGVGKSGGTFSGSTTADFAGDTEAALAYMKTRADIDSKHIGLLGHSEGGIIAPMVAARHPEVAFVVMLAGSGVSGSELMPEQLRQGNLAAGMSQTAADASAGLERQVLKIIESDTDNASAAAKLHDKLAGMMPEAQLKATIASSLTPWFRYFLAYDPAPALRQLKCPVLALNGSLDRQVSAAQNLPAIRRALEAGGNQHFEILEMPGLNHLFQTAKTGAVTEYTQIEETMAPAVLEKIASWIPRK